MDNPEHVYQEFYNKLKSGGKLIIYDANWHIPFYNNEMMERVGENERKYYEDFGEEFKVYDDDTSIFENLPLSNIVRPKWDIKVLKEIGFKNIETDLNVGEELYSETPLFEICAVK